MDLDNVNFLNRDSENLIVQLERNADDYRKAWRDAQNFSLPPYYIKAKKIVLLGMGGSGIASEVVKDLLNQSDLSVEVVHDYGVPGYVDENTLVIANSYSGDTEETLDGFVSAYEKGAKLIAITTGGKLEVLAEKYKAPVFKFNYPSKPRAAFVYLFIFLLSIFDKLGHTNYFGQFEEICDRLAETSRQFGSEIPTSDNLAKQLSLDIYGKTPIIYAGPALKSVAKRFKAQFNENSKSFSFAEFFPELNHNAILGYSFPDSSYYVILLKSSFDSERIHLRQSITEEILHKSGIPHQTISLAAFNDRLEEIISTVLFADFVSYYLAILNDVDPSPISNISYLKSKLT